MKSIKDLKEQYNGIVESESKEERKLTTLVRSGLFDAKKLPALKRAMDKPSEKMTPAEKKILIDLLDSLINQVVSSDQVYSKVKRNVQDMHEELKIDEPVTIKQVPSIVVFKRRAVRVYPGGRQVGLYYSYQLDKYITIPFGDAGLAMESVDRGTTGVETEKPNKKPKKPKKPPSQDEIDNEIERKDFSDISPEERKRVTPGKVFIRSLKAGQKPSVIAAKTLAAFMFSRKNKNASVKSSGQKVNPSSYNAPALKPVKGLKTKSVPKLKTKSIGQTKAAATKTMNKNPGKSKEKLFSKKAIEIMNAKESFRHKLNLIREARQYGAADAALDAASFVPGPAGSVASLASAGMSLSRGDYVGAALDAAGAIPVVGYAAKAAKVAKLARGAGKVRKGLSKGNKLTRRLIKARKLARNVGGVSSGSDSDNSSNSSTPQEKPDRTIKHNRQSTLKVNLGGPEYGNSGGSLAKQREILDRKSAQAMLQRESIELDGNQFVINKNMAEKIVGVYNSLNEENKKIMIAMLNDQNNQQKIYEFVARY